MTEKDNAISEEMVSSLCSFARTGTPNADGMHPEWLASEPHQQRVMVIGERESRMAKPSMLKMIKTMLTNKAVGE